MSSVKELFDLSGQVAVVTGGATGIGLQMAKGLAEAGANIVICSRRLDVCEQAIAEIEKIRSSFALKQVKYKTALPLSM